jgi:hypothetical protein
MPTRLPRCGVTFVTLMSQKITWEAGVRGIAGNPNHY